MPLGDVWRSCLAVCDTLMAGSPVTIDFETKNYTPVDIYRKPLLGNLNNKIAPVSRITESVQYNRRSAETVTFKAKCP